MASISGAYGADTLKGGMGDDLISGFEGDDSIDGQAGADVIDGGSGNDTLNGSFGDDTIIGGSGNDTLIDDQGSNVLDGGEGNDNLSSQSLSGNHTLKGGSGSDSLNATGQSVVLEGGTENDYLSANGQLYINNEDAYVVDGRSIIDGGEGDDSLSVNYYANASLSGGAGDDQLNAGQIASSTMDGGAGNDNLNVYIENWSTSRTLNDESAVVETVLYGGEGDDTLNVEGESYTYSGRVDISAYGGAGDDTIAVRANDAGNNQLSGNDRGFASVAINGGDGSDTIRINGGLQVRITTGAGSDVIEYSSQQYRTILEGSRNFYADGIYTSVSADPVIIQDFTVGEEGDVFDYGDLLKNGTAFYNGLNPFTEGFISLDQSGEDTLIRFDADGSSGGGSAVVIAIFENTLASGLIAGNFSPNHSPTGDVIEAETISGTYRADTLKGGMGDDLISGFEGDDSIDGQAGADVIDGGSGNDTLNGSFGDDTIIGGSGNDTLIDDQGSNVLDGGEGNDNLSSQSLSGNHTLKGGSGSDSLNATGQSVVLEGGTENDYLSANGQLYINNEDAYVVDGRSIIDGGEGDDSLSVNYYANASLSGGAGDDQLNAGQIASSTMDGGAGNDNLNVYIENWSTSRTLNDESAVVETVLYGGEGDDTLNVEGESYTYSGRVDISAYGGAGDDTIAVRANDAGNNQLSGNDRGFASVAINGGDGSDTIRINGGLQVRITTGAGSDVIEYSSQQYRTILEGSRNFYADGIYTSVSADPVIIQDFTVGEEGDVFDYGDLLKNGTAFYNGLNPFTEGFISLDQSGEDTLIRFDADGSSGGGSAVVIAIFENTLASGLIAGNFSPNHSPTGDVIEAETISGTYRADTLKGGMGDDLISGFEGDDSIDGQAGADVIDGGSGNDTLNGSFGDDTIIGGSGNDTLIDDQGSNVLDGGEGNDNLSSQSLSGNHTLKGGSGSDSLNATGQSVVLEGGTENDYLSANGQLYINNEDAYVVDGRSIIDGGEGDDSLSVNYYANASLSGGAGDDQLNAGQIASSTMDGGAGNDNLNVYIENWSTSRTLNDESAVVETVLYGGEGDDTLNVEGESYTYSGRVDISAYGGAGDDTIAVRANDAGNNQLSGNDRGFASVAINGGDGSDTIRINGGLQVRITTGAGSDVIEYSSQQYRTILEGSRNFYADGIYTSVSADPVIIQDFTVGEEGDVFDYGDLLKNGTAFYNGLNPFTEGFISLDQSGEDTLIRFDADGSSGSGSAVIIAVLENTLASGLVADNFSPNFESSLPDSASGPDEDDQEFSVISDILLDPSYGDLGYLLELGDGNIALYNGVDDRSIGDKLTENYKIFDQERSEGFDFDDAILLQKSSVGFRVYFWDASELYSHDFIENSENIEAIGSFKEQSFEKLYEIEDQYHFDIDGDDEIGKPAPVIERLVAEGLHSGSGSLLQLQSGEFVFANDSEYYEEGDDLLAYYQVVEDRDLGDVTLDDAIAVDQGSRGPRIYFLNRGDLYSQEFRERNDQLETSGTLKSEKEDRLYELEEQYDADFDGDGDIGQPAPVIDRVLLDGSDKGYQSLFELEDGRFVVYSDGVYYEEGDGLRGSYQVVEDSDLGDVTLDDAIAVDQGSRGPRIYFLNRGDLYSQEFRERNDQLETSGTLKSEKEDRLYELEEQYDADFDGDGDIGQPAPVIDRVLLDGSDKGYQSLFELEDGRFVVYSDGVYYEEGDELRGSYQVVEDSDLGDVTLDDAIVVDQGSRGPRIYFLNRGDLYSQEFRERNDQLETSGTLKSEKEDRLYELEEQYDADFDGDGDIGQPAPVIDRVLLDGSDKGYQSLFELEDGRFVVYSDGVYYEEGDELGGSYQVVEDSDLGDVTLDDAIAVDQGSRGPRIYFLNRGDLYSQEFRERNDQLETSGTLKSEKENRLYELEEQYDADFDGDGSIGEPSLVIERVIFEGSDSGGGSLFELESGEFAFTNDGEYYEEGDELTDYYQTIEENDFGDVTLDDAIAMQWGNRGPRIYFLDRGDLYSQDFRDRNGDLQASGKLKSVSQETLYELEDIDGEDYDGDGEIGEPTQVVKSVLFSGSEGSWDRGLYELGDASLVMADPELEEGDTPSDVRQLVTSNGDNFSIDGEVLGGYGINRGFAVLYEDGARIMRQNFRETGDVARTNGRPQSLSSEKVAALEDEHGVDYNNDGVYGSESSEIASVLFDGEEGSWGWGLYEMDDASLVIADAELGEGDTPSDSRQLVTNKGDDFSVDGEVLGGYGINRGFAVLYEEGARIIRQNFRETGDVARTHGKPKSLSAKQVAALEDDHGVDYNNDGVYGSESSEIVSVLFDGEEGSWGWGLYEMDDASLVIADAELGEGDTPSDSRQLVTNKGDDFSVDGEVLGGYGINRGFAVLYEEGARIIRQNFRETGDVARTNGKPKSLSAKQVAALEDDHGVDYNRDGVYGSESSVITSVLYSGEEGSWGWGLYELDDASLVIADAELGEGDTPSDSRQLVTNKGDDFSVDGEVLGGYGINRGFAVLYEEGARIIRQNFRETGDVARTNGKPKSLSAKQVAALEDDHGVDYNRDGVYGSESSVIASVLFDGEEGSWGWGLYELDDASVVVADVELGEGDTPSDSRQLVTNKGDDFSVDGEVLGGYGINRGFAVLYEDGARIMRQNFRETGDVARTNGKPKSLSAKQVAALEDDHGVDYNRDGVYGSESSVIASVLFDGEEGSWGRGLYELDDASVVVADAELGEGDTPSDSRQLVTNKGDDFSVDGEVLGGYGINRGFAVLYEDGARIMRQNFRETGDVARTNGKPQNLSDKKITDLEDQHGVDYNRDSLIGAALPVIDQVLFDGLQGDWKQGIYAVDGGALMIGEQDLNPGDELVDGARLLASGGDLAYSVDGQVVGAYGSGRTASLVYEDNSAYFSQRFRLSGSDAVASGAPAEVTGRIYAMEDQYDIDFTGDGVFGEVLA